MSDSSPQAIEMTGVREYADGYPVCLSTVSDAQVAFNHYHFFSAQPADSHRYVARAMNQGGYDCTAIDLLDLLGWLKANRTDILQEAGLLPGSDAPVHRLPD